MFYYWLHNSQNYSLAVDSIDKSLSWEKTWKESWELFTVFCCRKWQMIAVLLTYKEFVSFNTLTSAQKDMLKHWGMFELPESVWKWPTREGSGDMLGTAYPKEASGLTCPLNSISLNCRSNLLYGMWSGILPVLTLRGLSIKFNVCFLDVFNQD